jgi:DNA-binding helix-hairpin-helix protein with protein kinase domain
MNVYVDGRKVALDPRRAIGKGGEADVYDVGGGEALKVWKSPQHPDYRGLPAEQDAARRRIEQHQRKLDELPRLLPPRVIAPRRLARDKAGRIAGYTMRLVAPSAPLMRLSDRAGRDAAGGADVATAVLRDMHATVAAVHRAGVVIGDFNDLNVLIAAGAAAHFIDVDSWQFGGYPCLTFTDRFRDPRLPDGATPDRGSDWFAYAAMVLQSLLFVGPWGGVHPKVPAS